MHSYYFTARDGKRIFYDRSVFQNSLTYQKLFEVLESLENLKIANLLEKKEGLVISFNNGLTLTVDYPVFAVRDGITDVYFESLRQKVKDYREKAVLKSKFNGYIPTVNRHKSHKMGPLIVSLTLASSLVIVPFIVQGVKEHGKDAGKGEGTSISNTDAIAYNTSNVYEPEPIVTPELDLGEDIVIDYAFDDRTDTQKLPVTIEYAGDYIEYYAKRWGLPVNLCLAQISQERPNPNERGEIDNICQLTYQFFTDRTFKMPVFNENGFTGEYDIFTTSEDSIKTLRGNIMTGLAYLRECVDKTDSFITGLYIYNQGDPSFAFACNYYNVDASLYKGDANALKACELITNYNRETKGEYYGDYNYLEHVFSYLPVDYDGKCVINGYIKNDSAQNYEPVEIAIHNTLGYNFGQPR